jgi:hypothetical protein
MERERMSSGSGSDSGSGSGSGSDDQAGLVMSGWSLSVVPVLRGDVEATEDMLPTLTMQQLVDLRRRRDVVKVVRRRKGGDALGGQGPDPLAPLLAALLTDRAEKVVRLEGEPGLLYVALSPEKKGDPSQELVWLNDLAARIGEGGGEDESEVSLQPASSSSSTIDALVLKVIRVLSEEFHARGVMLGSGARAEHVQVKVSDGCVRCRAKGELSRAETPDTPDLASVPASVRAGVSPPQLGSYLGDAVVVDWQRGGEEGSHISPSSLLYVSSPVDAYPGRDLLHLFSSLSPHLSASGEVWTTAKTLLVCAAIPSPAFVVLAPFGVLDELARAGLIDADWVRHAAPVGGEDPVWVAGRDADAHLVKLAIHTQQVAAAGKSISLTGSAWARRDGAAAARSIAGIIASLTPAAAARSSSSSSSSSSFFPPSSSYSSSSPSCSESGTSLLSSPFHGGVSLNPTQPNRHCLPFIRCQFSLPPSLPPSTSQMFPARRVSRGATA